MSNPIMNKIINRDVTTENVMDSNNVMTVDGTVNTTLVMGLLLITSAVFTFTRMSMGYTDLGVMLTGLGAISAFILALIIIFTRAVTLVPFYGIAEGLFLGGVSAMFELSYPGVVVNAVAGTFAALIVMLILYRMKVIQCTEKFRAVVIISTVSIGVLYLINILGSFFGYSIPFIFTSSNIGIGFSLFVIIVASLNLIIDFDFIERGAQMMLPKKYEWLGAFGLMVTLVWLYIEFLNLFVKLQSRD